MLSVGAFHITAYRRISVACPFERLERRESDNTYRVHCLGHVHGVVMTPLGE